MGSKSLKFFKRLHFSQVTLILALMLVIVIVITSISPIFMSYRNIINIFMQVSIAGILTAGMAMLMISGGIDLAVGNQLSFIGCLLASLIVGGMPEGFALVIVLAVSIVLGFITGVIIAQTKAQPFIITLGMMSVNRALALIVCNGSDIPIDSFEWLGRTKMLGIMLPVWLFIILFVVMGIVLKYTRFGRMCYAVGSNEQAAFISGVAIKKKKVLMYSINGLIIGFAAAVSLSRLGSATALMGDGLEMKAIAACAIGGITLSGGTGSILGGFIGLIFLGIIQNGLNMMEVPTFYQYLVNGIIIIAAVIFSTYSKKK